MCQPPGPASLHSPPTGCHHPQRMCSLHCFLPCPCSVCATTHPARCTAAPDYMGRAVCSQRRHWPLGGLFFVCRTVDNALHVRHAAGHAARPCTLYGANGRGRRGHGGSAPGLLRCCASGHVCTVLPYACFARIPRHASGRRDCAPASAPRGEVEERVIHMRQVDACCTNNNNTNKIAPGAWQRTGSPAFLCRQRCCRIRSPVPRARHAAATRGHRGLCPS